MSELKLRPPKKPGWARRPVGSSTNQGMRNKIGGRRRSEFRVNLVATVRVSLAAGHALHVDRFRTVQDGRIGLALRPGAIKQNVVVASGSFTTNGPINVGHAASFSFVVAAIRVWTKKEELSNGAASGAAGFGRPLRGRCGRERPRSQCGSSLQTRGFWQRAAAEAWNCDTNPSGLKSRVTSPARV